MPYDEDGEYYHEANTLPEEKSGEILITVKMDQHMNGSMNAYIAEQVVNLYRNNVNKAIIEAIDNKVFDLIDDTFAKHANEMLQRFFDKPHRRTNTWGERTGEEVTMREIIQKQLDNYLDQMVDPKSGTFDKHGRGDKIPRLKFWINKLAKEPLQEAIDKTVGDIAATAKAQIQGSVSRYIAEQLAPTINAPPAIEMKD